MNIRIENWQGYEIRFVEQDGEWLAILKDVCAALGLQSFKVSQRLGKDVTTKIAITAFKQSPAKVIAPAFHPKVLNVFVAPELPLPCSRMSIPCVFP